jgi:hypothetical protein
VIGIVVIERGIHGEIEPREESGFYSWLKDICPKGMGPLHHIPVAIIDARIRDAIQIRLAVDVTGRHDIPGRGEQRTRHPRQLNFMMCGSLGGD